MSTQKAFIGLCVTCNNAPDCVYRKLRGSDAIFCEMFDSYVPAEGSGSRQLGSAIASSAKVGGFKGLCVNCSHREDCMLPRPEGGVWHCEEYE